MACSLLGYRAEVQCQCKSSSRHFYLETRKRVIGKQCRPRSDATVASDQDLHCLLTGISIKNKIKAINRPDTPKMTNGQAQYIKKWKSPVYNGLCTSISAIQMTCTPKMTNGQAQHIKKWNSDDLQQRRKGQNNSWGKERISYLIHLFNTSV